MDKKLCARLLTLVLLLALLAPSVGQPQSPVQAAQDDFDCSTATGIPQVECEALVALYNATDGPNWANNTGWLETTTPCSWNGVTCRTDKVSELWLPDNNLNGALPPQIGDLGELMTLGLGNNLLTSLPITISALSKLTWATLSGNMLTSLPAAIGDLAALRYLHLDGNQLAALPQEIGSLAALSELYLHDNPLSGPMPPYLTGLTALGQDDWYPGSPFTFYNTGWCVPAAGVVPAWLAGFEYEGTGVVCDQLLGGISGTVTLSDTTPIPGIQVHLYRALGGAELHWEDEAEWLVVSSTLTIADGSYQFGGLGQDIDYRVRFVDPTDQYVSQYYNSAALKAGATSVTVTLGAVRTGIDAVLGPPQPPASSIDPGSGTVNFNPDGTANVEQFRGHVIPITVTRSITCPGGLAPADVQLLLVEITWGGLLSAHPMEEIETGLYRATIPAADIQTARLNVSYTCGGDPIQETVGYITLHDPSGIITDARSGEPVGGATVTLYHVPGWLPRSGPTDTRPNRCESNLSKAQGVPWSQPAPVTLGMVANPENPPIAPAIAHQETNAIGYYGWDVSEGCWYVQVKAKGYALLVSPVVGVPPEVIDLDLALTPLTFIYLPLVLR